MRTSLSLTALIAGLFLSLPTTAQDRYASLPGFDQYQHIQQVQRNLITGGTISRVRWSNDGRWLTFTRSGTKRR